MLGFCVDFINKMYLDFAFTEHVKLGLSTGAFNLFAFNGINDIRGLKYIFPFTFYLA